MTKQGNLQSAVESAKEALGKISKEKHPKLFASKESEIKALEIAIDKERWVKKTKKTLDELRETKTPKKEPGEKTPKKEGFDYAEKAFLKVNDVLPDEYQLVQQIIEDTGKTIEEVLDSKYFRAEQKELREHKASTEAIPDGSKRAGTSGKDKVEYWLAKGELPPADQPQLRRDYVNAKLKKEADTKKFTDTPIGNVIKK